MTPQQAQLVTWIREGRHDLADQAELLALSFLVHPRTRDGRFIEVEDAEGHVLWPMDIVRGWGPDAISVVEWGLVTPCARCWRALSRRAACRKCDGRGFLSDMWHTHVITDMDGIALEDSFGNSL